MVTMLVVGLLACGGGAATDQVAPPVEPATAVASGATKAALDEAAAGAQPMQPWGVAETALKGKLGEPTVNDANMATWTGAEGGKCYLLTVTKMMDSVGGAVVAEVPCP